MQRASIAVLSVTFQQFSDQMFPTFDSLFLHENGPIFSGTRAVQARTYLVRGPGSHTRFGNAAITHGLWRCETHWETPQGGGCLTTGTKSIVRIAANQDRSFLG
jgi:hypothetical protein